MTRDILTSAAAAGLLALAGAAAPLPAAAQEQGAQQEGAQDQAGDVEVARECLAEVRQMSDTMNREGYTPAARPMQTLYDAALIFANNGQVEACEAVVEGMDEFMRTARARPPMETATMAQLEAAPRIGEMEEPVQMSRLLDAMVLTPQGEALGDVDDMVTAGDTRYLLIGTGGFLGLGEEYVPVRMDRLRYAGPDTLVLDVDPEQFEGAPAFDTTDLAATVREWGQDVETWWETEVEPATQGD